MKMNDLGSLAPHADAAVAPEVFNSVDQANAEHGGIADETGRIGAALTADPVRAVASGSLMNFVESVEASTERVDPHLTDLVNGRGEVHDQLASLGF